MTDTLQSALHALRANDCSAFRPLLLPAGEPCTASRLEALLDVGDVREVHDTLRQQLCGLLETRHPSRKLSDAELNALVADHADPTTHGVWVHYPWSGRLVRVLPRDEFQELRSSRNRNKITADEQAVLRDLTLGVVGLSVGQATALTLALEGVGGRLRLADFDHLELSNLNRLRGGVHQLGVAKTLNTARAIAELDPYIDVDVFPEGVHAGNLDAFLTGAGRLDLVFDECDDLAVKVRLRERARALRIPVMMETSDRGLLDIERFDQEPQRPLFHGLVGDLKADDLEGLSTYDKVPTVMKIIGQRTMSSRMAASMIDIETTLPTWPQLASAVALGGSLNTDAARRLALGTLRGSGRFFVDVEQIVSDDAEHAAGDPPSFDVEISEEATSLALPRLRPGPGAVRDLVAWATTAPSGGNCQPWRFEWDGAVLRCLHDRTRSANYLDFRDFATHLAFGALLETLELAAPLAGLRAHTELVLAEDLIATVSFSPSRGAADLLSEQIPKRVTNRRLGERVPLPPDAAATLSAAARAAGGRLQLITQPDALDAAGRLLGRGDRVRLLNRLTHGEMMAELRWNAAEVEATRDGVDVATLELTPTDLAAMRMISSWRVLAMADRVGGGAGLEKPSRKAMASASGLALLTVRGQTAADRVRGGRALQRVWLTAAELGLAVQPMTAITHLFDRLAAGEVDALTAGGRESLAALRAGYEDLFDARADDAEIMLFRLAVAGPPTARSLRRRVDDVLVETRSAAPTDVPGPRAPAPG